MAKVHEKQLAISLRKEGYTYRDIMKKVPNIAKSTISVWCAKIELTPEQIQKLNNNVNNNLDIARIQAGITNRNKRLKRDEEIYKIALQDFNKFKNDPLFILGTGLYWAEGAKTRRYFQFTNSDPIMVEIMIKWIEKYLNVPRNYLRPRLYIHKAYENENCRTFWSIKIGIPEKNFMKEIYKQNKYDFKKNEGYKGCIRIDVSGVSNWLKAVAWQKLLVENTKI